MQDQFQKNNKEFYHNLALIKLVAFLKSKFGFKDIQYLKAKKEKLADLVARHPEFGLVVIELKQKIKENNWEERFDEFFFHFCDICTSKGYNLTSFKIHERLAKRGMNEGELKEFFKPIEEEMINAIQKKYL